MSKSHVIGKSRRVKRTPYEERVARKLARRSITRPEVDGVTPSNQDGLHISRCPLTAWRQSLARVA